VTALAGAERSRLDEVLVVRGLAANRSVARGLIMAGLVSVAGKVVDKAGTAVTADADISIKERPRFVSRGGDKLAHALEVFRVDVLGVEALDVGASTGGFVDCLLQGGAVRVIALDVGRAQLDSRLRADVRVAVMEKINARYLTKDVLPFEPDFVTMDVSFISIAKVLPAVVACMAEQFEGVILVKPQFEAGRASVGKGGIVRDASVHRTVLAERGRFVIDELDADLYGMCRSGLRGTDGNEEFFLHLGRGREKGVGIDRLDTIVNDTLTEPDSTEIGRDA
jgi:23S rRNA (cytidine1920-2'-O)/16S rRNA (cytidine1409-2'-O)-methyltransferase